MKAAALAALVILGAAAGRAHASDCSLTAVSPVGFGGYDLFAPSPTDSTGSITIACTAVGPADTIRVELSRGSAAGYAARTLMSGAISLAYNLYLDAARTSIWGDGSGGSAAYGPLQPADGSTAITIYGRIPAGQDASAGAYADTVVVTLQF